MMDAKLQTEKLAEELAEARKEEQRAKAAAEELDKDLEEAREAERLRAKLEAEAAENDQMDDPPKRTQVQHSTWSSGARIRSIQERYQSHHQWLDAHAQNTVSLHRAQHS
jgi:hypothetical protein